MRKQPERTERTRQALMDSFWDLYRTKKIDKITVQAVVDGAGVYRSTFYEYFLDVYDVLETIEQRLLKDFEAASNKTRTFISFEAVNESMLSFYEENGAYIAHLLGPNGDPAFSAKALKIIKGIFLGKLRLPDEDLKSDILFELMASSIITLLNYWYANRERVSFREVFQAAWPILRQSVLPSVTQMAFPQANTDPK